MRKQSRNSMKLFIVQRLHMVSALWTAMLYFAFPYLSQHGVRQLADLLHVLSADIQLAATDPQKGTIGKLLAVQLHFNEVVLPSVGVLDTHLQHQL